MTPRDIAEALLADGWVHEPGQILRNRLARGTVCACICWDDGCEWDHAPPDSEDDGHVEWGVLEWDGRCSYARVGRPGSFHELMDMIAEMDRDAMEEPL